MRRSTIEDDARAVKKWAQGYCAGAPAHTVVHEWLALTTRYSEARAYKIKCALASIGGKKAAKNRAAQKKREEREIKKARQGQLF